MTLLKSTTLVLITFLLCSMAATAQLANNTIEITTAVTDNQNNSYTIGQFQGTVNFNFPDEEEHQLKTIKNADIFIQKTDVSGNLIWVKQLITTSNSTVLQAYVDADNHLYILGMFEQVIDLDPSNNTYILSSEQPAFFMQQLDAQGKLVSAQQLNSNNFNNIPFLISNILNMTPVSNSTNATFSLGMDN